MIRQRETVPALRESSPLGCCKLNTQLYLTIKVRKMDNIPTSLVSTSTTLLEVMALLVFLIPNPPQSLLVIPLSLGSACHYSEGESQPAFATCVCSPGTQVWQERAGDGQGIRTPPLEDWASWESIVRGYKFLISRFTRLKRMGSERTLA